MQSIVIIGNFDGCHRGHQELLRQARALDRGRGLKTIAVTFSPRPEMFFRKCGEKGDTLFTDAQKVRALKEYGADEVIVIPFTEEFARKSHEEFFYDFLVSELGAVGICLGGDFCFGFQRRGNREWLLAQAKPAGVDVIACPPVIWDGEPISSTRIRREIAEGGALEDAAEMLGRPYALEGIVGRGDQMGRKIGFPTANLHECAQLLPKDGVYLAHVWTSSTGSPQPTITQIPTAAEQAVVNVGTRPTVAGESSKRSIEAHVLNTGIGPDDLYGHKIAVYFHARLRAEAKFASVDELRTQIGKDITLAKSLFAASPD